MLTAEYNEMEERLVSLKSSLAYLAARTGSEQCFMCSVCLQQFIFHVVFSSIHLVLPSQLALCLFLRFCLLAGSSVRK